MSFLNVETDHNANSDGALDTVGQRLRFARERAAMTQQDIADFLDLTKGSVSGIENDKQGIQAEYLFPLADMLDVSARWLISGEGEMAGSGAHATFSPRAIRIAKHLDALPDRTLMALQIVLGIKL